MKYLAGFALIGALCFAEQKPGVDTKPACNAVNKGHLWPEAANTSAEAGLELFERAELEKCSLVKSTFGSKYKWQHLSVNVHDLEKRKQTKQRSSN